MWPFKRKPEPRDFAEFRLGFDAGWAARDRHALEQMQKLEKTLAERGISLTSISSEQAGHFVSTDANIKH